MTATMRAPRSRGGLTGTLLVLLGLWGGLLPFAGPYFGFGFAPDDTWVFNADRLQLAVAPAAAAVLGGLIVLAAANRALGIVGALLAALGGAWFAVGHVVATLWDVPGVGAPLGSAEAQRIAEQVAGFTGLGVVVAFLAGIALGRFAVAAAQGAVPGDPAPPGSGGTGATQPLVYGRYAQQNQPPGDRRVAGERDDDR